MQAAGWLGVWLAISGDVGAACFRAGFLYLVGGGRLDHSSGRFLRLESAQGRLLLDLYLGNGSRMPRRWGVVRNGGSHAFRFLLPLLQSSFVRACLVDFEDFGGRSCVLMLEVVS